MVDRLFLRPDRITSFKGPAGAPGFKTLLPAYRELLTNLSYASIVWRDEGDGGVKGARLACQAIARFIGVRHQTPELATPFLDMLAAFDDLKRNLDPELFSKEISTRERPRTTRGWHLRLLASVAMDVLMRLGKSKNVAANIVARHVANWPGAIGSSVSSTRVAKWRRDYTEKSVRDGRQFELLRDYILEQPDAQRVIEQLLRDPRVLPKMHK